MKQKFNTLVLILVVASLPLMGLGCKGGDQEARARAVPLTLTWWGTGESKDAVTRIATNYQQMHPNVTVQYRSLRAEDFDVTLINALASGKGPDIVSLPNTKLKQWSDKLTPMPEKITLPYLELAGTFKKEPTWVLKERTTITLRDLKQTYVEAVADDAVIDAKVYGLPISFDTLVLYYNRTLMNGAGIPEAPTTWTEFKNAVQQMTKLDKQGRLLVNGASLGDGNNVRYASDIITALMLQNGTKMTDGGERATFHMPATIGDNSFIPGVDAVRFYTDFANPTKETYSWSADESDSFTAFTSGKVGFMFGYLRDEAAITAAAPGLKFGYSKFPQIDGALSPIYFASYALLGVTKNSKYSQEAWDFIQFFASADQARTYVGEAKQTTARRDIAAEQLRDPDYAVGAAQALAAKTWYRGYDVAKLSVIFSTLVRQVLTGAEPVVSLTFAAKQVSQTLLKPAI